MFWPIRPKPTMPSCTVHAPFTSLPIIRRRAGGVSPLLRPTSAPRDGPLCASRPPLSFRQQLELVITDQDRVRHAQKQPRTDHARDGPDLGLKRSRVGQRLDGTIEDVVAVIG